MKVEGRYIKVLEALDRGPKSSEEILRECGFSDTFHCSSALSILVRQGLIAKGYRLTEAGKRVVSPMDEPRHGEAHTSVPRIPEPPSPGFEWFFDEAKWEWAQRRKPGFEVVRSHKDKQLGFDLFG